MKTLILLIFSISLLHSSVINAQSAKLRRYTFSNGGSITKKDVVQLRGTLGQYLVGKYVQDPQKKYQLGSGFWPNLGPQFLVSTVEEIPANYKTEQQNFPNPASGWTTIPFTVENTAFVEVKIFSLNGQLIETLVSERLSSGNYKTEFNAANVENGTYIVQVAVGERTFQQLITILH